MSATVQNIYNDCCSILLEPSGLVLGLYTPAQFIQAYREVMDDFLGRTGLIKAIAVIAQEFGIPQYVMPDWISEPEVAITDGTAIRRDFEGNIGSIDRNWQNKVGSPRSWRQDKQLPNQVSLYPAPNVENPAVPLDPSPGQYGAVIAWAPLADLTSIVAFVGTMTQSGGVATFTSPGAFFGSAPLNQFSRGNLCLIGATGLLSEDVTLSSPVEAITDDWLHFIKYGILEKIWLSDSELKDVQRARYARARYDEGCMLAAAVMGEEVEKQ